MRLADALDSYIPTPKRAVDQPFLMPIEDVFSISGRGTVVTGRVEKGVVKVGEEIEIVGIKPTVKTTCTGVEMFRKLLDEGQAGDNVGVLLRGTKREDVERGQVLSKPGAITPHTKFECEVYVLSKDEGGRHTPFFNGYRPQFYFRTTDVTGSVELPAGTEMVMPGDNIKMVVTLINPIAMEEGLRFACARAARPSAPASWRRFWSKNGTSASRCRKRRRMTQVELVSSARRAVGFGVPSGASRERIASKSDSCKGRGGCSRGAEAGFREACFAPP